MVRLGITLRRHYFLVKPVLVRVVNCVMMRARCWWLGRVLGWGVWGLTYGMRLVFGIIVRVRVKPEAIGSWCRGRDGSAVFVPDYCVDGKHVVFAPSTICYCGRAQVFDRHMPAVQVVDGTRRLL